MAASRVVATSAESVADQAATVEVVAVVFVAAGLAVRVVMELMAARLAVEMMAMTSLEVQVNAPSVTRSPHLPLASPSRCF